MAGPTHLTEGDYPKAFPPDPDSFPSPVNEEHYIDAWLLNTAFDSLLAIEEYLIDFRGNIEAPIGDDIIGDGGQLEINIPPARYPAYKHALAWDSNLLEENIKLGITIFGVTGTLSGAPPAWRWARITWSSNWGDSLVGMSSLWLCNQYGEKYNTEAMAHTSNADIINGTPQEMSNINQADYWQVTAAFPRWWKVDMVSARDIRMLKTQCYTGAHTRNFKDFILEVTDDNINWTTLITGQTADNTLMQTFNVP